MSGDSAVSILRRLIDPSRADFNPAAAEAVLQIEFGAEDQARVAELAVKCTSGTLSGDEAAEYDNYVAAADFLALLKSRARLSLKHHSSAA
jgi:hypothetical protein